MNKDLLKSIDEYIDCFLSMDIVKKYFILEKQINESKEIDILRSNLKVCQKNLALSISDENEHIRCLELYENAKKEFQDHPLICNYNLLKEEIYNELKSLEKKLND